MNYNVKYNRYDKKKKLFNYKEQKIPRLSSVETGPMGSQLHIHWKK